MLVSNSACVFPFTALRARNLMCYLFFSEIFTFDILISYGFFISVNIFKTVSLEKEQQI